MANLGNYQAAVDLFTQAIKLDAKDFRFVCYSCSLSPILQALHVQAQISREGARGMETYR